MTTFGSPDVLLVLVNDPALLLQSEALWFLLFPRQRSCPDGAELRRGLHTWPLDTSRH